MIITNEDNMELMARYPDKYFDLAIVDPPYGIGASKQSQSSSKTKGRKNSVIKRSNLKSKEWIRVKRWDFDPFADVNTWGSNSQTITIGDVIIAGRTVKVMYATSPSVFTSTSQDYTTQTGLPESTKDVVILGAAYRLLQYLDPARAAQYSPQADEIDAKRPFGASNNAVRQLYALYTQRLNEERTKQQTQYPPRVHYSAR